ncbi:MAG: hypothetical protein KBG29_00290 [Pseudomonadales bacterium]|nr:hypothetical protein [Pseudomonadales bacterium]
MAATISQREETFEVLGHHLVRKVVPVRGQPYEHRCPRAAFEQIAHAADELGETGFTLEALVTYERNAGRDVTFTNVAVALAFLRERSILDVRYRRNYAATCSVHLDAMTEFFALAEEAGANHVSAKENRDDD